VGQRKKVVSDKVEEVRGTNRPIDEITKDRREGTVHGFWASLYFALTCVLFVTSYQHIVVGNTFLTAVGGVLGFYFAWSTYSNARWGHLMFRYSLTSLYMRRYIGALDILEAEGYNINRITDKNIFSAWRFYWAKDLKVFEEALFDYLRSFRRAQDLLRKQVKWRAANTKLTQQLEILLQEFNVTGDEREEVLEDFSFIQNPNRRKEFLATYRNRMAHERWVGFNHFLRTTGAVQFDPALVVNEEDFTLKCLEKEASRVTSDSARSYYLEGLNADSRRDKKRFFNRALIEDVRLEEMRSQAEAAVATCAKSEPKTLINEVKYLSLQDFARERLASLSKFQGEVDWRMAREVVLVLADPGRSGGRFKEHYFPDDKVRRLVRRHCELYGEITFEPKAFEQSVSWLRTQKVLLLPTAKVGKRVFSLSNNVRQATPAGVEIIAAVLRLKREMSGLPS
jgi:hypothetical protein